MYMKKEELINLINDAHCCSLWQAEDIIPREIPQVAEGLKLDQHRWYSTAINVYQCEDGFVGVWGAYQSFSEMQMWEDLDVICEAFPMKAVQTITYVQE
jgi:hypothetical protein